MRYVSCSGHDPLKPRDHPATDHVDEIIDRWSGTRPDLDPWPLAAFGRLKRAAEMLERRLAPLFTEPGIHGGEFEVLSALRRAGPPFEMSLGDLSRWLVVSAGGISNRVDNLERLGLVARHPHPEDRRALLIRLTADGVACVDELLPAVIRRTAELLAPIESDRDELARLLRVVLVELEGAPVES